MIHSSLSLALVTVTLLGNRAFQTKSGWIRTILNPGTVQDFRNFREGDRETQKEEDRAS